MAKFTRTINAVARAELSLWPVVEAIVKDLGTGPNGGVKNGEYGDMRQALVDKGFRSWSVARLQGFHSLGAWVNLCARRKDFRKYPVEWVIEARKKAEGDHTVALEILAEATSKRDIRPDKIKVGASEIIDALTEDEIRNDFLNENDGLALVAQMNRELHAKRPPAEEPLPSPPNVGSQFWKTVQDTEILYEAFEKFGLGDLVHDPEAHERALRMQRQAGEVAAAFAEAATEANYPEGGVR